ncbi:transglutaminase-like putative cysteine protease [Arcicella aurantiaca]|uniref:Transglutaminase-like putative cysteine protease n=1 Tax=Arcicella aurantiaca TaxID=591202 RepID=A0A316E9S6_9BACT|nr:transglutaminase family protein [Arcicella aurantiaca]PWK26719.1 transglutaminase-like putative cysteine protease [Arcicella aurantiaca]
MKLKVACQLDYESKENVPLILILRPQNSSGQQVIEENYTITPKLPISEYKDVYGNLCQRLVCPVGSISISTSSVVEAQDNLDINFAADYVPVENLPADVLIYLLASRYCEVDKLFNLAVEITQNITMGYSQVDAICQWVRKNIRYEYGHSCSSTSAFDISQSKIGVCRDFSHLCMALCRCLSIPARMVVGYLYDLKPMDLHAWFEAYIGDQWYTFDATQSSLKGNRVVLAYGRDANDVAFSTQFGEMELLNMWVSVEAV